MEEMVHAMLPSILTGDGKLLMKSLFSFLPLGLQKLIGLHNDVADLSGIIGPLCSEVCEIMALLAAAWDLPVVSYYCPSIALSDKSTYPTFA